MAKYNIEDIGGEVKASYYKKLKDVNLDCCPCQIPSDVWKSNSTRWLDLEFPDIYVYLIETQDIFIREFMKNRKSLEAHNQSISGWVRTVYHYRKTGSNFMILRADIILDDGACTLGSWVSPAQCSQPHSLSIVYSTTLSMTGYRQ